MRVQCKTAWPKRGCMLFNSRTTDHGRGRQPYWGLADIFGVYFPPTRDVYLVPLDAVAPSGGHLRLDPTRNNQQKGIRLAAEFAIARWSREGLVGLVAGSGRDESDQTALELAA